MKIIELTEEEKEDLDYVASLFEDILEGIKGHGFEDEDSIEFSLGVSEIKTILKLIKGERKCPRLSAQGVVQTNMSAKAHPLSVPKVTSQL